MSVAALETALAASPDDPLVYAAYADALCDAGDPRGDCHRLLAAMDDPASGVDRKAVERELRRQWASYKPAWTASQHEHDVRVGLYHLDGAVPLARIRVLRERQCARLATRPVWWLLRGVRIDRVFEGVDLASEFGVVARSRVRTLRVHDRRLFNDAGLEALLASDLFERLTELHLPGCNITDGGADALAAHPHTPRLNVLDLDRNHLSPIGHGALAEVGVHVSDRQYFMSGGWDFDPPAFPADE